MKAVSLKKRVAYLGGLLVFLVGYHFALNQPGSTASEVLPAIAIMFWGDLVRELVSSRTPGTDDATVRSRRKRLATALFVAGGLTIAATVAAMIMGDRPGKLAGYLGIALFMGLGAAGLGLIVNDLARDSAKEAVAGRRDAPVGIRLFVLVITTGIFTFACWNAWSDWSSQHTLSTTRLVGMAIMTVMLLAVLRRVWLHLDEYQDRAQALLDATTPE